MYMDSDGVHKRTFICPRKNSELYEVVYVVVGHIYTTIMDILTSNVIFCDILIMEYVDVLTT